MFGIVLFGRPYSAFSPDASKGIPHKIASRGFMVIPFDMLPAADIPVHKKMYWGMGQKLMKAAAFVQKRENLFGFFTTNFSCGPDSFILGYFRRLMGQKPSLTLEVDQHTADAGIDTRVEAALDIMTSYRRISAGMKTERCAFRPARVVYDKTVKVISSDGRQFALTDPEVEVVLPSMGRYATEAIAAVLRGKGIRTKALPVAAKDELLEGRRHATCKECLPYLVTTGSFMNYLKGRENKNVVTLLFMATGGGPCRLGQYCTAMEHIIEKNRIETAASFGMTDENGYAGLGARMLLKAWQGMMTADIINDIRSMLAVTAQDPEKALAEFESEWQRLLRYFEGRISSQITTMLSLFARKLSKIPLKKSPDEVPVISLVGEIFVRRDEFSRKNLVDYLENAGFMVRVAPVTEFLEYSNWVLNNGLGDIKYTPPEQIKMRLTGHIQEYWEWRIKSVLAKSGLYKFELIEIEKTIESARHLIKVQFRGEAILTVGCALREILHDSCGIISLGPFGCMPSRMAESILKKEMNVEGKRRVPGWEKQVDEFADLAEFPFFALETDGLPFPQLIEANLEAFLLQARRVHTRLLELKGLRKKRLLRHHPIVKLYKKVTGMKEEVLVK
jgi:predicted nucleotide-binding protein (sugar kinase/HSP70/actin superfamily)